jgi:hypothetical protein
MTFGVATAALKGRLLGPAPAQPQVGRERHPVGEACHGESLHVVWEDELPALERCAGSGAQKQRQGPARAGADLHARKRARGAYEVDEVPPDGLAHLDALDGLAHGEDTPGVAQLAEVDLLVAPKGAAADHVPLGVAVGVAHRDAEQEPVELRLRQGVGALVLDRVLGRHDREGRREEVGDAVGGHLVLLHRLEQRGLGLWRRPVDLVAEHEVREHRPGPEHQLATGLVEHSRTSDVRRHKVGRELDPGRDEAEHPGERAHDEGLREARDVFQEHVAAREHPDEDEPDRLALADHGPLDLGDHLAGDTRHVADAKWAVGCPGAGRHSGSPRASSLSRRSPTRASATPGPKRSPGGAPAGSTSA